MCLARTPGNQSVKPFFWGQKVSLTICDRCRRNNVFLRGVELPSLGRYLIHPQQFIEEKVIFRALKSEAWA
jgi:hypothetical protein